MAEFEEADVVVIGGGSAAHESAIAAKHYGADRVVMLEKAPEEQSGGNARFSGTGFRFAFEPHEIADICDMTPEEFDEYVVAPYSPDMFLADLNHVTQGKIDPALADVLVNDSNAAIRWSKSVGLEWEVYEGVLIEGKRHLSAAIAIHPKNLGDGKTNGLSQLIQWDGIARRVGVDKRYDSKVIGFLGDETGIEGVQISGPDGRYEIRAKAVIACAGGFQANPQMRARYLGPNADLVKVRGSRHNTGEVLQMLLDLGVQPAGHWQFGHGSPIDYSAPVVESGSGYNRYSYPWGLTVNENAERFFDEGEAESAYTYAKTGWAVMRQPGGTAFHIGDSQTWLRTPETPAWHRPDTAVWADTIEELAEEVGLDPASLARAVAEYNDAIDTSTPYDPTRRDGRRTVGLSPDKTNWAQAIDNPPYSAIHVTGGLTFTYGGVSIDTDARVLAIGGKPIPGLYASGDILGLFFHNYPAMTGQTRNLVFGHRAGRHAAGRVAVG